MAGARCARRDAAARGHDGRRSPCRDTRGGRAHPRDDPPAAGGTMPRLIDPGQGGAIELDELIETLDAYPVDAHDEDAFARSEEHTSELQSRPHLVCRLL